MLHTSDRVNGRGPRRFLALILRSTGRIPIRHSGGSWKLGSHRLVVLLAAKARFDRATAVRIDHLRGRAVCAAVGAGIGARTDGVHESAMSDRLLKIGLICSVVTAICCFTPVLVILLGAVGLSTAVGYLDYVLFPALALFLMITGYAIWRRR